MEEKSAVVVTRRGNTSERVAPHTGGTPARVRLDGRERKKILLIEPDEDAAQLILELLTEDSSYDVVRATDPVEAFSAIAPSSTAVGATDQEADLVMLDLTSLDSDHKRALRALFDAHKRWPPTIILSGWPVQYVENVLIGIDKPGVVAKPFDVDTLLCTVHRLLKTNRN